MCPSHVHSDRSQYEIGIFIASGSLHCSFNLNILKQIVIKCARKDNFIV